VCRDPRQFTDTPIVIITGCVGEIDRLLGIELGADDYICKPFSPREVVARVKAILRRSRRAEVAAAPARLVFDVHSYEATLDGMPLRLTPAEFRLLHALAERPNWVFSRDQLLEHLYADHRIVGDRTIDGHIKNLRRKLRQAGGDDFVRSVSGVGYKIDL
jgi:two-component system response regulator BaeR